MPEPAAHNPRVTNNGRAYHMNPSIVHKELMGNGLRLIPAYSVYGSLARVLAQCPRLVQFGTLPRPLEVVNGTEGGQVGARSSPRGKPTPTTICLEGFMTTKLEEDDPVLPAAAP